MYALNKKEIKDLLERGGTVLKYGLGQNYLTSGRSIKAFINNFPQTDQIIEIGPGIGNITINYMLQFKKIILIELDPEKIPLLRETLTRFNNGTFPSWIEIINDDVLNTNIVSLIQKKKTYQIIGALPYNVSKKVIRMSLGLLPTPIQCTFIIQKEVADKYTLTSPEASFLSVSTEAYAKIKKREIIRKDEFYPVPKIDSRIVTISDFTYRTKDELTEIDSLAQFIKKGFANPRKKLSNTLAKARFSQVTEGLMQKRPQELTLPEWRLLYHNQD